MSGEHEEFFEPEWMTKEGIKGFDVDPEIMDFETKEMQRVRQNMKDVGYDPEHYSPIVIARSKIPDLSGKVLDGKHRLVFLEDMIRKGYKLPRPFILGKEDINDEAEFEARRIHYERQHLLHKSPKVAEASIRKSIKKILKIHPELAKQSRMSEWLTGLDMESDISLIESLTEEMKEHAKAKEIRQSVQVKDWTPSPGQASIEDKAETELGQTTSYRACPCGCKPAKELAVFVDNETKSVVSIQVRVNVPAPKELQIQK